MLTRKKNLKIGNKLFCKKINNNPPSQREREKMGYIRHHAIIVTCCDHLKLLTKIRDSIRHNESDRVPVSDIMNSPINGYASFTIYPDGSKEGWETSTNGDLARKGIINLLDKFRFCDGSSFLSWVEVQYGDGDRKTKIISHSDQRDRYRKAGSRRKCPGGPCDECPRHESWRTENE